MNRYDAILLFSQIGMLILGLLYLPGIIRSGLTPDNLYSLFMLLGALTLVAGFGTNIFTNTLNREDYSRHYPLSVRLRWSWINTIVQGLCIIAFAAICYYLTFYLSDEQFWRILSLLWILLCFYNIYREWRQRRIWLGRESKTDSRI